MTAAKHHDKIRQREYDAMTRGFARHERHEALLQQHKEYRERQNAGVADVVVNEATE